MIPGWSFSHGWAFVIAYEFIWCLTKGVKTESNLSFIYLQGLFTKPLFTTTFFHIFKNLITLRYYSVCPPCLQFNSENYQTDKETFRASNILESLLRCTPRFSKSGALICMLRSTFKLLHDWADFQNRSRKDLAQQHICTTLADSVKSLERDSGQLWAVAVHPVNPK